MMYATFTPNMTTMELDDQPGQWTAGVERMRKALSGAPIVHRGRVHAQDVSRDPSFATYELQNVVVTYPAPRLIDGAQSQMRPNLPWAEDHFQERIGGVPLNPSPSEAWWPYRKNGNAAHKNGEKFSHTYPERMWPKEAGVPDLNAEEPNFDGGFYSDSGRRIPAYGIRFDYGDFDDVCALLSRDRFTRQAYLPIWFPEDTGATDGQRVPCSLGYHFIARGSQIDCQYFMRSCDFFRHYVDDAYMAVRLMQVVVNRVLERLTPESPNGMPRPIPGTLTMFISNLHAFVGDEHLLQGE